MLLKSSCIENCAYAQQWPVFVIRFGVHLWPIPRKNQPPVFKCCRYHRWYWQNDNRLRDGWAFLYEVNKPECLTSIKCEQGKQMQ